MSEQVWTTVIGAAIPTMLSLLVIFSTRERSSGTDHSLVTQTAKDVEALKTANVEIQTTLATHTNIHRQTERCTDDLGDRLRIVESAQNQALGREQGRHHESRRVHDGT